jgi:hypothetical protein
MLEKTKGTIFIGESYGVRVTIEIDRADIGIEDAFNAFSTILAGLGWSSDQIKSYIMGKAAVLEEEEENKK